MSPTSAELLRMLGSVLAPNPAQNLAAGAAPAAGLDFASLLRQAGAGDLSSGLGVTIAKGAGVQLSNEQLLKLAAAADRAEAQGATRALVLIDGRALKLDVAVRQITGEADLNTTGVLTGIDAVVSVPSPGAVGQQPGTAVPLPRAGYASPSLLRLLGASTESPP